ncbi:ABC transporter ATP-binding protein/permease [Thalassospiraceae bacterium LMO-JJ14]|nr:ABC transporter ATP-binding protein/permease [Thalassospiraceae bacterium LMO-JJ14]
MTRTGEWTTVKTLLPYLWPSGETGLRVRVVVAMVLLIAAKATNVSVPIFYKQAVDILTAGGKVDIAISVPVALIVGYGICRVAAMAFGELRDAVFTRVAQRAIRQAGLKTFRHLHHLSMRFHLERKTGGVARAVERGTSGIEFLLRFMLFNVLPTILEVVMVCGILWKLYGFAYAALTLGVLSVYIAWTLLVTEWRLKFRRAMNETDSEANTRAIDSLLNFETVKYFGNEDHEAGRFDQALQAYERAAVKSGTSLAFLNIGQAVIITIGVTAAMIMAGYGVADKSMSVGDFVLVNSYLIQIFMPLNFLGFVYREIKRSLTDLEAMFELLREPGEITDAPDARPLKDGPGRIDFDHVDFAYDQRRAILKDVSFTVPAGKKLAIVGPTGSGKSTISRILYRFYEVDGGAVKIDGEDIRDVTQKSLRAAIGVVPQDTVLFNDTIFYNIAYGAPGASPAAVENAARQAHIHDFIMSLPDGYQSKVGERGLKLSGGEKQRVAIARTILKDPRILVFDEATSALDSRTEQDILASFKDVSADRTTLTIAHRLSTVIDADEILVLQDGAIVERGTHPVLLKQDGTYTDMWQRQQQAREAEAKLDELGTGD